MTLNIANNVNLVQPGFMAPEFDLENVQGGRFALYKEIKKGPLVLNFFGGSWSSPCVAILKKIQRILPEFGKRGGQFAAVSLESAAMTARLAKAESFTFPLLVDADLALVKRYGLFRSESERPAPYPTFWVIDWDGVIRFKQVILEEKNYPDVDTLLDEVAKYRI